MPQVASEILVLGEERTDLAKMIRDYIAEMAEIIPGVDPDQPYSGLDLYWSEPERHWPFWLKSGDHSAGFALLDLEGEGDTMRMAEFFVARSYRRKGFGRAAARRLILRFPGRWRITQREVNTGAIAFWHSVLDGFAAYEEETTYTDAVRREQRFTTA